MARLFPAMLAKSREPVAAIFDLVDRFVLPHQRAKTVKRTSECRPRMPRGFAACSGRSDTVTAAVARNLQRLHRVETQGHQGHLGFGAVPNCLPVPTIQNVTGI